jgi:hypothetical protein
MAAKPIPPADYLRQLLELDAATGVLRWRERTPEMFPSGSRCAPEVICKTWNKLHAGKVAGYSHSRYGHLQVKLPVGKFLAHRLVWIMHFGDQPPEVIDHIDGDGSNNRPTNLRAASYAQNMANRKKQRSQASSKFKGVRLAPYGWVSRIGHKNERIHIGVFSTEEEAAKAYDCEARRIFGHYAKCNFPEA